MTRAFVPKEAEDRVLWGGSDPLGSRDRPGRQALFGTYCSARPASRHASVPTYLRVLRVPQALMVIEPLVPSREVGTD